MGEYKTPGVYIKEKNAFPNSVVEAETAIPVFIGLTEKAVNGTESLQLKPVKISSMTEYTNFFGGAPSPVFDLTVGEKDPKATCSVVGKDGKTYLNATLKNKLYTLYYNLRMFFANGGGTCYIASMGGYDTDLSTVYTAANKDIILANLKKVQDITLLVVPEAVNTGDCMNIYSDILQHCAALNRFAIFDIPLKNGDGDMIADPVNVFRDKIGANFLSYAAAYYPWLETSVLSDKDIDGSVLVWKENDLDKMRDLCGIGNNDAFPLGDYFSKSLDVILTGKKDGKILSDDEVLQVRNELHGALVQNCYAYRLLVQEVKAYLNLLPPSAAMAGIYTMVDNTRGVWKAPANVSVNYVNSLSEVIDNKAQEDLNVPMNGKAVNAIRAFVGEGIKVWGARTLNGNSQDWRYVNVRRTMSFLEQSVKNAARAYVFEPNDASTWINMKCMIENFLRGIWKRGGLAGASPEDAFSVHVGLGDTMTPEDILEGIMRITVLVAISHPAEFIEITFQQQMQKS